MSAFDSLMSSVRERARLENTLDHLEKLSTDRERVEFVMGFAAFQDIILDDRFCGKDGPLAEKLKTEGDRICLVEPWRAVNVYTAAVKSAPAESKTLASSYMARARALYAAGKILQAAEDARRSLEGGLPTVEAITALQLEAKCYQELGQGKKAEASIQNAIQFLRSSTLQNEIKARLAVDLTAALKTAGQRNVKEQSVSNKCSSVELPQLDFGRNSVLPAASAALKLSWSSDKGRHIVAKRDIPIGSVLIAEQPYAWSLSTEAMAEHCLHCCRLSKNPLACRQCATVIYCSTKCRDTAWTQYHQFECRILDHFTQSEELGKMSLLAFRIVVTARLGGLQYSPNNDSKEVSSKVADEKQLAMSKKMEDDEGKINQVFLSSAYSSVYGQVTHSNCRTIGDLFKRSVISVFLVKCLLHALGKDIDEVTLATAILRHLQSCSCNAYQISEQVTPDGNVMKAFNCELGGAVYPTISLCNHSCNPNIARHSHGNVCIVRALRRITKGEEILDNYGPHYLLQTAEERRSQLKSQYFFNCTCKPCCSNWPISSELQNSETLFKCVHCGQELGNDTSKVRKCSRCKQKLNYKRVAQNVQSLNKDFKRAIDNLLQGNIQECLKISLEYAVLLDPVVVHPCRDFVKWQQVITQCWNLLGNTTN